MKTLTRYEDVHVGDVLVELGRVRAVHGVSHHDPSPWYVIEARRTVEGRWDALVERESDRSDVAPSDRRNVEPAELHEGEPMTRYMIFYAVCVGCGRMFASDPERVASAVDQYGNDHPICPRCAYAAATAPPREKEQAR